MFEPISARLASSFSKKGMAEAAIDVICLEETSIKSTSSFLTIRKSWFFLTVTVGFVILFFSSTVTVDWANVNPYSSEATK